MWAAVLTTGRSGGSGQLGLGPGPVSPGEPCAPHLRSMARPRASPGGRRRKPIRRRERRSRNRIGAGEPARAPRACGRPIPEPRSLRPGVAPASRAPAAWAVAERCPLSRPGLRPGLWAPCPRGGVQGALPIDASIRLLSLPLRNQHKCILNKPSHARTYGLRERPANANSPQRWPPGSWASTRPPAFSRLSPRAPPTTVRPGLRLQQLPSGWRRPPQGPRIPLVPREPACRARCSPTSPAASARS